MSYLSSILSSIGDEAPKPAAVAPRPAPPAAAKRKATEELTSGPAKRPTTPANGQNGDLKRPVTPSNTSNATAPKPKPNPVAPPTYQGAARPNGAPPVKKPEPQKQQPQKQAPSLAPLKTNTNPTTAPAKATTPTANKPPPKPGSYAAIIAKAKAAQQSKTPVGVITHKQGEKIDRNKALKAENGKDKNGLLKDKKAGDRSRTGSAEVSSRSGDKTKQKARPLEKDEYKGSAKPSMPAYTGSARPNSSKKAPPKRYDGYVGTDEEMDDYDDEEDYFSDESDMEAGAFDVEREEQEALRRAKKDDAMELALENRLKAEKAARKKALADLAAARRR